MRVVDGKVTDDGTGSVHEHFGFCRRREPAVTPRRRPRGGAAHSGGFDRYDPSAPLSLVPLKDPGGGPNGFGTYPVYRKLGQDVINYRKDESEPATTLAQAARGEGSSAHPGRAGALRLAYVVGRLRDGTPVVEQAVEGGRTSPSDLELDADVIGVSAPFHAHAREMNPRGDKARLFAVSPGGGTELGASRGEPSPSDH